MRFRILRRSLIVSAIVPVLVVSMTGCGRTLLTWPPPTVAGTDGQGPTAQPLP